MFYYEIYTPYVTLKLLIFKNFPYEKEQHVSILLNTALLQKYYTLKEYT